jgi:hypothetical protein
VTKQRYIHSSLDVILCLSLHVHDHVENVSKHVFFYMHNVKVMTEKIGLPIRKLIENISLYPVIGQTKTKKLRLTGLENQTQCHHSLTPHHTILHRKKWGCNILFNFAKKKILYVISVHVIRWQEMLVAVKKTLYPCFLA